MVQFPETPALTTLDNVLRAAERLRHVVTHTPLMPNDNLSARFGASVWLKREDLQVVRSYKVRGAYNKMISLPADALTNGVVCASAGNHAQGVAYACRKLGILGTIFMPTTTPNQKVKQVRMFGQEYTEVVLTGDTFDDAYRAASTYCDKTNKQFIHPFNDLRVIEGQGTVGLEILADTAEPIDYLVVPVGGGGLSAGIATVFRQLSPRTRIIGVEPLGAPAMYESIRAGYPVTLDKIDKFVDGAAVQRVGDLTFAICRETLDRVLLVPEGKVCSTILQLYNEEAIVVEPAGALSIAALDQLAGEIVGKNVVCVVSGSNNDITRTEEIKERSLLYEGLKHYFLIRFAQRAGALREFLNQVLGENDDIVHFEYSKKNSRAQGSAVVGIEVKSPADFAALVQRMDTGKVGYEYLNERPDLLQYLV